MILLPATNKARRLRILISLLLLLFAGGCRRTAAPPEPPPTPTPPTEPAPTPTPTPSVTHQGEWIVTFAPPAGEGFTHALQISADASTDGFLNAGGGLEEFCAETCGGSTSNGFGLFGDLILSDGTTALTLAILPLDPDDGSMTLKVATVEPIVIVKNADGQETFTTPAVWWVSESETVPGTVTATNVGEPRDLEGFSLLNIDHAVEMIREVADYSR